MSKTVENLGSNEIKKTGIVLKNLGNKLIESEDIMTLEHSAILEREFQKIKSKNPKCNEKQFAKFLGIKFDSYKGFVEGKIGLTRSEISQVIFKLRLGKSDAIKFHKSSSQLLKRNKNKGLARKQVTLIVSEESAAHDLVKEWEYFAVLALAKAKDFNPKSSWISKRLNIEVSRAEEVVLNLIRLGIIDVCTKTGDWIAHQDYIWAKQDGKYSTALKEGHFNFLDQAKSKIESVPKEDRNFNFFTFSMSSKNIPMAKLLMEDFRKKFVSLLEDGEGDEVFQIGLQFFPLTELKKWKSQDSENKKVSNS